MFSLYHECDLYIKYVFPLLRRMLLAIQWSRLWGGMFLKKNVHLRMPMNQVGFPWWKRPGIFLPWRTHSKKRAKYMIAWTEVVLHSLWCCSQTFLEGILISGFQSYSSNIWEYTSQNYFQTLYLSLCLGNTVDGKILHRRMPPQYHYLFGHWKWCRIFPSTVWCVLCTSFIFGYGISTNVPW